MLSPMPAPTANLHSLLGPIKARGIYDLKIQTIIQRHCEQGRIAEAADVVGLALYHDAVATGKIPHPRGIRTRELVDRAIDGIKKLIETYAKSGVLCAKGFYQASQLMLNVLGMWEADFATSVLQRSEETGGLVDGADPDFLTRSTIAAEKLRHLFSLLKPSPDGEALLLPISELEGLCVAATRRVYTAMLKPDVAVHEVLHGETPKDEDHVLSEEMERAVFTGWQRARTNVSSRTRLLFQYHLEEGRGESFATGWYLGKLFELIYAPKEQAS